jgi:hypothetical protein
MTETNEEAQAPEEEGYPEGALVFRTLPHAGSWTPDGDETYVDLSVVKRPSKALVRSAGHAHAAGVIEVLQGLDTTGVQSQEDGEAEYAKAVEDGLWHEGQEIQAALEQEAKDRGEYGVEADVVAPVEEGGEVS